jgi:hypothetical protein
MVPFLASRTDVGLRSACLNGDSFLNLQHRRVIDFDPRIIRAEFAHSSLIEQFFTTAKDRSSGQLLFGTAEPWYEPDEVIVFDES